MDGLHLDDIFVFPDDQYFQVYRAPPEEHARLEALVDLLSAPEAESGYAELRLAPGRPGVDIPRPALEVLAAAAAMLLRGDLIEVRASGGTVSIPEAAALLDSSPEEVGRLIESDKIPHQDVSTVRIAIEDLVRFGRREAARRRVSLDELHRVERELGLDQ